MPPGITRWAKHRRCYEHHIGNARDIRSQFETYYIDGKVQGLAEGEAKGKAEGKAEIIKNMHRAGFSVEQIALAVAMTQSEIKETLSL